MPDNPAPRAPRWCPPVSRRSDGFVARYVSSPDRRMVHSSGSAANHITSRGMLAMMPRLGALRSPIGLPTPTSRYAHAQLVRVATAGARFEQLVDSGSRSRDASLERM